MPGSRRVRTSLSTWRELRVIVPAGTAPGGNCAAPVSVPPGITVVTETIPVATVVAGISTLPSAGLLVSSNLLTGSANVMVTSGGQTIVTFIDAVPILITAPVLAKAFGPTTININGSTTLIFTISNPNTTTTLTGINFTDTLPAGLVQVGGGATKSLDCGPGASIIVTGTNLITVTGVSLAPSATCILTVPNVFGVTDGTFTNITSLIGSVQAGNGPAAAANIIILPIIGPLEAFQVLYASNLNIGDSIINLTNTGTLVQQNGLTTTGNLCINTYTFDSNEEMISCCSCLVTPNGLNSLSAKTDLISNTLTPGVPTSIVTKMVASIPLGQGPNGTGGTCDASSPTPSTVAPGLGAWGTTLPRCPPRLLLTGSPRIRPPHHRSASPN